MTISVFLVDDHELFLSGVRAELDDRFDVVGWATDVDQAIDAIRKARPDVVLVDVHMPGGGGLTVVKNIKRHNLMVFCLEGYIRHSKGDWKLLGFDAGPFETPPT
jgi:DNA-binding NarL/FixJ family response regulator